MHTSPHYYGTVDHHTKKGQQFIKKLREEVRAYNVDAVVKHCVKIFGKGPRKQIAKKMGKPHNYYYFRRPPLRHSTCVDVYIYRLN